MVCLQDRMELGHDSMEDVATKNCAVLLMPIDSTSIARRIAGAQLRERRGRIR